jgi:hypothetical protein
MKTKILGIILALNCCTAAYGNDLPSSYSTEQEAAVAALSSLHNDSIEYAGIIYEDHNQFFYTEPQTNNETAGFNLHVHMPKGAQFVAIYHTHPGSEETNKLFSPPDVAIAKKLNVHSYIGITELHLVKLFIPGRTHTEHFKYADGRPSSDEVSYGQLLASN